MKTRVAVAAFAVLLAAHAARAAEGEALAAEVARTVMPKANYEQLLATLDQQMRQMVPQMLEKMRPAEMDAGKASEMMKELAPVLADEEAKLLRKMMPAYEEMTDLQARLLAKHYTRDGLRKLRDFYRTPLGQKAISIMPEVTKDAMAWMQERMMERMPAAMGDFKAAMEATIKAYAKEHGDEGGQ